MILLRKKKINSCTTIKEQFEILYTPDVLEKINMYIYLVAVCFYYQSKGHLTHTIKIPENLFLPIVSVHNHLPVKQQEINDERGL